MVWPPDTLYVDVSRYAASPIAKIRSHLKYWMDKASWHKPSLLVLDNIDKLMGTELEVCIYTRPSPPRCSSRFRSMQTLSTLATSRSSFSRSLGRPRGRRLQMPAGWSSLQQLSHKRRCIHC